MHSLVRALQVPLNLIPPDSRVRVLLGPLRGAVWIVGSGNHYATLHAFLMTPLSAAP